MWLGIDFGTCYSSAAFMLNGHLERVKDSRKLGYSFPSSVYVSENGEIFVGHTAEFYRNKDPNRYRREFKRELGQDIPYQLVESKFMPQDLVKEVLRKIKNEADKIVEANDKICLNLAVITVPATYQKYKRDLMQQAGQKAGFTEVELLDEPVAAAIYYAQYNNINDGEIILVYDLGGGTFDATLMQKQGDNYQLLTSPLGLDHTGGIDFDRKIYEEFYAYLSEHTNIKLGELLTPDRRDLEALRARLTIGDWCREMKHQLSEVSECEDIIPSSFSEFYKLKRDSFNKMIEPYIDETIELCQQLVKNAKIDLEKVDRLLLVGGSCRIPYVKEILNEKLKRPVFQVDEPDLAICLGAAVWGTVLDARKEAEIYISRGLARLAISDYQSAIKSFNQALQIYPNSAQAYGSRGLAYYMLKKYQETIADCNQALEMNPNLTLIYFNRGLARLEVGADKGALEDFNQAGMISDIDAARDELKKINEQRLTGKINESFDSNFSSSRNYNSSFYGSDFQGIGSHLI